jgi:hypothetical protein
MSSASQPQTSLNVHLTVAQRKAIAEILPKVTVMQLCDSSV